LGFLVQSAGLNTSNNVADTVGDFSKGEVEAHLGIIQDPKSSGLRFPESAAVIQFDRSSGKMAFCDLGLETFTLLPIRCLDYRPQR